MIFVSLGHWNYYNQTFIVTLACVYIRIMKLYIRVTKTGDVMCFNSKFQ